MTGLPHTSFAGGTSITLEANAITAETADSTKKTTAPGDGMGLHDALAPSRHVLDPTLERRRRTS